MSSADESQPTPAAVTITLERLGGPRERVIGVLSVLLGAFGVVAAAVGLTHGSVTRLLVGIIGAVLFVGGGLMLRGLRRAPDRETLVVAADGIGRLDMGRIAWTVGWHELTRYSLTRFPSGDWLLLVPTEEAIARRGVALAMKRPGPEGRTPLSGSAERVLPVHLGPDKRRADLVAEGFRRFAPPGIS